MFSSLFVYFSTRLNTAFANRVNEPCDLHVFNKKKINRDKKNLVTLQENKKKSKKNNCSQKQLQSTNWLNDE